MPTSKDKNAVDLVHALEQIPAVLVYVAKALPCTFFDFCFRPSKFVRTIRAGEDLPDRSRYLGPVTFFLLSWVLVVLSVVYSIEIFFAGDDVPDFNDVAIIRGSREFVTNWNLKGLAQAMAPVLAVLFGYAASLSVSSVILFRKLPFRIAVVGSAYWCGCLFNAYTLFVPPVVGLFALLETRWENLTSALEAWVGLEMLETLGLLPAQVGIAICLVGAYRGFLVYIHSRAGFGWPRVIFTSLLALFLFVLGLQFALGNTTRIELTPRKTSNSADEGAYGADASALEELPPTAAKPLEVPDELSKFYFDEGLEPRSESESQLRELAEWLRLHPHVQLEIEGHTSASSAELDRALGADRARLIQSALQKTGIPQWRMRTISYGSELPVCHSATPDCIAKNDRVQVVVALQQP
jgi:outer membrane protein OmpA-like peptidoglycan-associated protein